MEVSHPQVFNAQNLMVMPCIAEKYYSVNDRMIAFMIKRREELDRVKKALQSSHKGMMITEISQHLNMNRNSVAKYLDMLCMAGEVDMHMFGRSKIFTLSDRVSLAAALSISSELIAVIDDRYKIIDVNNRLTQFAEVDRERIVGQSLETVGVDLLTKPEILLNLHEAFKGKEYSREFSIRRGNETHYFKFWLKPLTMSDINSRVAIVYENITARKTAEIALRESEARYRAIVEDQKELICRLSQDTTILFVNDSFCSFFGTGKDDITGKRLVDILTEEGKEILSGRLDLLLKSKKSITYDQTHSFPGGKTRFVNWTGHFIPGESDHSPEYQIVGRDITDYIMAEKARKQSEECFQKVYDMMPAGSSIVLPDFRYLRVNREYCRITGYSEQELLSLKITDIVHPDDIPYLKDRRKDMVEGLCDWKRYQKRMVRKDGTVIKVNTKVMLFRDDTDKPEYFLGLVEEVSEDKR